MAKAKTDWRKQSAEFESLPMKFQYMAIEELLRKIGKLENALVVVLDHITDVGNLGAVIRSAEVVGAAGVIIPNKRAAQVNEGVFRASAGAVEHLSVVSVANLSAALTELKNNGFWVAAASEHATQTIWEAPLTGRIALVMGAEDTGISRLLLENTDFAFKLPQYGQTQSLNVAQAATAIMYEYRRRIEDNRRHEGAENG